MLFGLRNASAMFQQAMDAILASVKWQHTIVYSNDIVIFSKTTEQHYSHLKEAIRFLRHARIMIKLESCSLFRKEIDYLGHKNGAGKLQVEQKTTEAIDSLQYPTIASELRSFFGLCNVYPRFVPNFARPVSSLSKKLKKCGAPTIWPGLHKTQNGRYFEGVADYLTGAGPTTTQRPVQNLRKWLWHPSWMCAATTPGG